MPDIGPAIDTPLYLLPLPRRVFSDSSGVVVSRVFIFLSCWMPSFCVCLRFGSVEFCPWMEVGSVMVARVRFRDIRMFFFLEIWGNFSFVWDEFAVKKRIRRQKNHPDVESNSPTLDPVLIGRLNGLPWPTKL